MKFRQKTYLLFATIVCFSSSLLFGADNDSTPVTPNASPEAKALLEELAAGQAPENAGG